MGDATSRACGMLIVLAGEMGYPSALTAPKWGFYDGPSLEIPSLTSRLSAAT